MLKRDQNLAIYMEGELAGSANKMCVGILRYAPNEVAAVIDSGHAGKNAQDVVPSPRPAPVVGTVEEARRLGADVFVLGVSPPGGKLPPQWGPAIDRAIELGMCVLNGLHERMADAYPDLAPGQWIWDIRVEPEGLGTATGAAAKLPNKRLLMIGTDMAIGKMTAGLEIFRAAKQSGVRAEFIATGQIGITITGKGVPLDAVRVDYACGAMEREVLAVADAELVIVEGQGALIHPGSTANLPLLRGTCPTHLVLCHKAGLTALQRYRDIAIPPLRDYIQLYEDLAGACGTFPRPTTVAVALNTLGLEEKDARRALQAVEDETGLRTGDPVRFGAKSLFEAL